MPSEEGVWLAAQSQGKLAFGEKISSKDAETIHALMNPINALGDGLRKQHIQTAWVDFNLILGSLTALPRSREWDNLVLSKLVTWLSAFRTHLNHGDAFWTRSYPAMVSTYKRATAAEFDREDRSYAFTYHLRNYTDHVDTAGINIGHRLGEKARVVGHRNTLIENYNNWHSVALNMLRTQPEDMELLPIFHEAMQGLGRIHDTSNNLLLLLSKASIAPLRIWADCTPAKKVGGSPALLSGLIDPEDHVAGKEFKLSITNLMSHDRLDRLEAALCDSNAPLTFARVAFDLES